MANRAAIQKLDEKVEKTGALSGALAGLKGIAYNPAKPTQIMGAVSTYKGEHAYALGVGHYTSEDLMVHGGLAFTTSSDVMANIGATIRVGSGHPASVMNRDAEIMQLHQEIKAMKMRHEKEILS